jgi:signal peptidase II
MGRGAFYAIALLVVALDQAVKAWTRHSLLLDSSIPLWPGVFQITYTQNTGMAFSLLEGAIPLLAAAALLVIGVIVVAQIRSGRTMPPLLGVALALPLGGAVGNLIDRIWMRHVTDMFDFRLIHFPIFNVADSAITIGVVLLAWRTLTMKDTPPVSTTTPANPSIVLPESSSEEAIRL